MIIASSLALLLCWNFIIILTISLTGYGDWFSVSINTYERIIDILVEVLGATAFGSVVRSKSDKCFR